MVLEPKLNVLIKILFCSYMHFFKTLNANGHKTAQKTESLFYERKAFFINKNAVKCMNVFILNVTHIVEYTWFQSPVASSKDSISRLSVPSWWSIHIMFLLSSLMPTGEYFIKVSSSDCEFLRWDP